jgi:hypothetical protein
MGSQEQLQIDQLSQFRNEHQDDYFKRFVATIKNYASRYMEEHPPRKTVGANRSTKILPTIRSCDTQKKQTNIAKVTNIAPDEES